jgi:hypothetical protein
MQCDLAEELLTDVERMDKILGACDCEGLFSDFIHELSKREREARRNERKQKSEAFKSLIEGYEVITFETRHKELPEELEKDDRYKDLEAKERTGMGRESVCVWWWGG